MLALALSACGDSIGPVTLSPDGAAEVYVEATLQPYLLAVPLFGTSRTAPTSVTVNKSANCDSTGSFSVTGAASQTSMDLSVVFTGCRARRLVMDGTITISGGVSISDASVNWHGTLTLTGPQQGECWVDVVVTISAAGQTLTGTVCGADAAQLPDAAKKAGLIG